jgi:hypothetical protein
MKMRDKSRLFATASAPGGSQRRNATTCRTASRKAMNFNEQAKRDEDRERAKT